MSPTPEKKQMREHLARWEMVERVKTAELAAITEEQALQIVLQLGDAVDPWHPAPHTSGLVEQQAIFHRQNTTPCSTSRLSSQPQ